MAAKTVTFDDIKKQIASGQLAPIYIIHGAEGYYVDELVKEFEALVPEADRDFNLYQLYAPQVEPEQVQEAAMRYPMMADRQVVILKESQNVKGAFFDALEAYAQHPNPQTVLVVAGRGGTITGAKFTKAVKASGGVIYESARLYESQIGPKIDELVKAAGLTIDAKARAMLLDHVGTDLSLMVQEINKISTALPANAAITPHVVEKLIGLNKDFNNFELIDAIVNRDVAKAYRIVEYFRANPKPNPAIVTNVTIFNFFAKLLIAIYTPEPRTDATIAAAIGSYPTSQEVRRIGRAMRNFNAWQVVNAISACRRFDSRSKGIGSRADEYDLLRELIFTILN